ncbi:hypothetical protein [Pokkaliibacter sp. CJK22405]|uniref:hypothetical protein n=1 Tax=Pokkaliibacter sp. CJK22405 TaxID=3384615 RepID=UPI003984EA42
MSSASSAKRKQSDISDVLERAQKTASKRTSASSQTSQAEKEVANAFADIQSNTFYKIVLNPELTPAERKNEVAKALTFSKDKADSSTRLEEFNKFKEYLQHERKRMAKEIISLTDTGAFSELKAVYDEINTALMSFESKITPLTDIVDAVYTLRMDGVTFDVFREIADDKEKEAELLALQQQQASELQRLNLSVDEIKKQIAVLGEDKSWFGLGGVRKSSREKIATLEIDLQDRLDQLTALTQEIEKTPKVFVPTAGLQEYTDQKAKLRELLDISSDDHVQRQKELVNAAQQFINTTETRVGTVSQHFDQMNSQIDNLSEANYSMREIYAIINDATKDAEKDNETFRETLMPVSSDEGDIEKMARERTKRDLENHIKTLGSSAVDTTSVLAELTTSSHRIKSMQDANEQQISKTRQLHSSGVAGVADQLSTVLQAVSSAALGESSEMARMSLERMQQTTNALGQKEVIRVALGAKETNAELAKALEDLEQYGQVVEAATNITRQGLEETKELLGKLENTARDVQDTVQQSFAVAAEVTAGKYEHDGEATPQQSQSPASPFGF